MSAEGASANSSADRKVGRRASRDARDASGDLGLSVEWLGCVDYAEALALQMDAVEARRRGKTGDRLLLLEHPAVVTLGRSANEVNLLEDRDALARRGVDVHEVGRGGDVTYHAPGQLVGYCILDLRARPPLDLHRYLRDVEGALIDALETLGIDAERIEGKTGVFVEQAGAAPERSARPRRKLASIGVGVRHWISYHGFALNVSVDLGGFDAIVPCGLRDVEMTSVARELGLAEPGGTSDGLEVSGAPVGASLDERVREVVAQRFRTRFGRSTSSAVGFGSAVADPR